MLEILIVICITTIAIVKIVTDKRCKHNWETIKTQSYTRTRTYYGGGETKHDYTKYHMQCLNCGEIKVEEL